MKVEVNLYRHKTKSYLRFELEIPQSVQRYGIPFELIAFQKENYPGWVVSSYRVFGENIVFIGQK